MLDQLSLRAHTASYSHLGCQYDSCSGAVRPQQLPCCPGYHYHLRYRRSPCTSTSPKYNVYMYTNISVHINMLMYTRLLVPCTTCTTCTPHLLVHCTTCAVSLQCVEQLLCLPFPWVWTSNSPSSGPCSY